MRISLPCHTLGTLLFVATPAIAGAQVRQATNIVARKPDVVTRAQLALTPADRAAMQAFRTGLRATISAVPTSGPTPFVSAALAWPAYPHASGYQVLRRLRDVVASSLQTLAPVNVTPTPLAPSATSVTVQPLVPAGEWNDDQVVFNVVALVNGAPADTASIQATLPYWPKEIDQLWPMTSTNGNPWPPPTAPAPGIVVPRACMSLGPQIYLAWNRNPAASAYRVYLIRRNYTAVGSKLVTDTSYRAALPAMAYLAYVRPTFAIHDWPTTGKTFSAEGHYVYFGAATLGALPLPCSQHEGPA